MKIACVPVDNLELAFEKGNLPICYSTSWWSRRCLLQGCDWHQRPLMADRPKVTRSTGTGEIADPWRLAGFRWRVGPIWGTTPYPEGELSCPNRIRPFAALVKEADPGGSDQQPLRIDFPSI